MPWSPHRPSELERKVETLSLKLLQANAALGLKTVYAERLEYLLHQRSERIDELTGVIDSLRSANQKLGLENHCLTALLVASPGRRDNGQAVPTVNAESPH